MSRQQFYRLVTLFFYQCVTISLYHCICIWTGILVIVYANAGDSLSPPATFEFASRATFWSERLDALGVALGQRLYFGATASV
jgi:hypothetical protein